MTDHYLVARGCGTVVEAAAMTSGMGSDQVVDPDALLVEQTNKRWTG